MSGNALTYSIKGFRVGLGWALELSLGTRASLLDSEDRRFTPGIVRAVRPVQGHLARRRLATIAAVRRDQQKRTRFEGRSEQHVQLDRAGWIERPLVALSLPTCFQSGQAADVGPA